MEQNNSLSVVMFMQCMLWQYIWASPTARSSFYTLGVSADANNMQHSILSERWYRAMFGGSTFLLFLLCYCCQRKMRENAFAPLDSIPSGTHPQVAVNSQPRSIQAAQSGPPPNYDAVVKKDPGELEPPPYEEAVASLQASGYV